MAKRSSKTTDELLKSFDAIPINKKLYKYYYGNNIWRTLHIERDENKHSAFIAWILGLGLETNDVNNSPIVELLRFCKYKNGETISNVSIKEISNEKLIRDISRINSLDRIDIYAKVEATVNGVVKTIEVIIENKIDSTEGNAKQAKFRAQKRTNEENEYSGKAQLSRYYYAIEGYNQNPPDEQLFIYLTPGWKKNISSRKEFIHITYQKLIGEVIEKYLEYLRDNKKNQYERKAIEEYLGNIGNNKNYKKKIAMSSIEKGLLNDFFERNKEIILRAFDEKIQRLNDEELKASMEKVKDGIINHDARFRVKYNGHNNPSEELLMYEVVAEFTKYRRREGVRFDKIDEEINKKVKRAKPNVSEEKGKVHYAMRNGKYQEKPFKDDNGNSFYVTNQWAFSGSNPTFKKFKEYVDDNYRGKFEIIEL